jgi:high-affinity Fe2+/Pb2+ permease
MTSGLRQEPCHTSADTKTQRDHLDELRERDENESVMKIKNRFSFVLVRVVAGMLREGSEEVSV